MGNSFDTVPELAALPGLSLYDADAGVISHFRGEHRFLSNFYRYTVPGPDSFLYPSVEHAYQAAKTHEFKQKQQIATAATAAKAKAIGKYVTLRPDWEEVKVDIMWGLIRAKFRPHEILGDALRRTNRAQLIEDNWWGDDFWGVCDKEKGLNWLGWLLMLRREELTRGHTEPGGRR